jgi:phosphoglucosamine mutase
MQLFGTDGIRGRANVDLTADLATRVARAAVSVLINGDSRQGAKTAAVIVGRDPRPSGEMLQAAIVAGLTSMGVNVRLVGVVPTPAVAYLTDVTDAAFGVMLSASHNPMPDNGIKFFGRKGRKLGDEIEREIERAYEVDAEPTTDSIGRVSDAPELVRQYQDHLLSSMPGPLPGLKVVVDCANGAAAALAGAVYRESGVNVTLMNDDLSGLQINHECGSTHLAPLIARVLSEGADLGLAHDGDADRCLAVDAKGQVVDGDQILAILALGLRSQSRLRRDTLVTTVMANLGLHLAMREQGISLVQTPVGDRYVLESMEDGGFSLGGEQSGHIVMSDFATTGDGILTGLQLMGEMARTGKSLSELASVVKRHPQVLVNVSGVDKSKVDTHPQVLEATKAARDKLGEKGRVLLRASGTEPLIRVMVEAEDEAVAQQIAADLAEVVLNSLSAKS